MKCELHRVKCILELRKHVHPIRFLLTLIRHKKLSDSSKRNLWAHLVGSMLALSFALEKFLNMIGYPLNDTFWFAAYGMLGLYWAYFGLVDNVFDARDEHHKDLPV